VLGILLVDKPGGATSHDVVRGIRRNLGIKRVGHAGTLDPLATGLLVVAVGAATRFLQYLPLEPKEYAFVAKFGASTTTYDADGEQDGGSAPPSDLGAAIEPVLGGFRGLIEQLPPSYSAVKHEGRPLYSYARKGEEAPRSPRKVHVDRFDLVGVEGDEAEFIAVCSGGTYVRTLVHDIGQALGCGAHVVALKRTRVGKFLLEDAVPAAEAGKDDLITLAEALPPVPLVSLNDAQVERVRHGLFVRVREAPPVQTVALTDGEGTVVGIARNDGSALYPECVLPQPSPAGPAETSPRGPG
jgi:tRNA pseudouridine55 synthase